MNQPPEDRYASAPGPVNRRTTPRPAPSTQELPAVVQQRLQQAQARQKLGAPLHQLLAPLSRSQPFSLYAALGLSPVLAAVGVWLLWPPASTFGLIGGTGTLIVSLATAVWAWRHTRREEGSTVSALPTPDVDTLRRLDHLLEQLAPYLAENSIDRLRSLKATLVRMLPLMAQAGVSAAFTLDDRHYVIEALRRYLPDSLQAFLQLPVHDVAATTLLDQQLDLMLTELGKRELVLKQEARQILERQGQFLGSKRSE